MGLFASSSHKLCKNNHRCDWADKFCRSCGDSNFEVVHPLPYVGQSPQAGVYRITIVLEKEFRNRDHAEECAGKSMLGEEEVRFRDCDANIEVRHVRSTVTPETHPFVCGNCRDGHNGDYAKQYPYLSQTDKGRCEACGVQNWVKR